MNDNQADDTVRASENGLGKTCQDKKIWITPVVIVARAIRESEGVLAFTNADGFNFFS